MRLTELQERILRLCLHTPREYNLIVRNCEGYQPQTIRNNLADLCLMNYLERRKGLYSISDSGRMLVMEGVEIVEPIIREDNPNQISLEVFAKK